MVAPTNCLWKPEEIESRPLDAIAWAKKHRDNIKNGEIPENMDGEISKRAADRRAKGLAICNRVELAALRFLVKKAVEKMDSKTTVWADVQGWCPEFAALKLA